MGFQVIEQITDFVGDKFGVGYLLQGGKLMTSVFRSARGHVDLLVPAKQGDNLVQVGDLSQQVFKLLEFFFGSHLCPFEDDLIVSLQAEYPSQGAWDHEGQNAFPTHPWWVKCQSYDGL
jgi:hypothetical protein